MSDFLVYRLINFLGEMEIESLKDRAYLSIFLGLSTTGLFVACFLGPYVAYPSFIVTWLGFEWIRYKQEQNNPNYQAYWRNKRKKEVRA